MNLFGWFTLETLKDILLHPVLQKIWEGTAPVVVEGIKKSFEEHRAEVVEFIMRLKLQNLWRRIKEAQAGNREIRIMNGLTKLYMYLGSNEKEEELRKKFFQELDEMNDEEFEAIILALEHDVIRQWFRRLLHTMHGGGKALVDAVKTVDWPGLSRKTIAIADEPKTASTKTATETLRGFNDSWEVDLKRRRVDAARRRPWYRKILADFGLDWDDRDTGDVKFDWEKDEEERAAKKAAKDKTAGVKPATELAKS